ncbi:Arm DNA-binding domain-containing protein [Brucella sp. 2716]|uniref:Arm DNA-binding domain-containing protein n=1 Tax=Brucella sp. 2716 TaxID=2975052 RepID=UPI00217CD8B0|nr:Arm DNA-binding domain-containing protein [Brucella sp. 2716]UWF60365.1 Arm DNA-binding domain-containing protein [Brucella sp. 2716]
MALTDTAIKALKQSVSAKKYSDANGLFLLVQPNGSKLWRYAYRFQGKQKTLSLGSYPLVGLRDARTKSRCCYR